MKVQQFSCFLRSGGTPRGLLEPSSEKVEKRFPFDPPPATPEVPFWEPFLVFSCFFCVLIFLVFLEGPSRAFCAHEAAQGREEGGLRMSF